MTEEKTMRDLFDRWERVWHEGQYDLIPVASAQISSGTTSKVAER